MAQKQERLFARTNQLHPGTAQLGYFTEQTAVLLMAAAQTGIGLVQVDLAQVENDPSWLKQAAGANQMALSLYRQENDLDNVAVLLNNIGAMHRSAAMVAAKAGDEEGHADNLRQSITALETAIQHHIDTKKDFTTHFGTMQHNLGIAHHMLASVEDFDANMQKAERTQQLALAVFTEYAYPLKYAHEQNELGNLYGSWFAETHDPAKALLAAQAFEEGKRVAEQIAPRAYAQSLVGLGLLSLAIDHYREAVAYFQQAADSYRRVNDIAQEAWALGLVRMSEEAQAKLPPQTP